MKKNILSGHGRIRIPLGDKLHLRGNPSGGWKLECLCGFNQEGFKNKRELESAYRNHIQESLPICNSCKEKKTTREMSVSCNTICKKCSTKRAKQWSIDNPNQWERQRRKSHLKKKYGITILKYEEILKSQDNKCAICETQLNDTLGHRPHIDHCHDTGLVRGILCGSCNKGIGLLKDSNVILKKAYNYLLKTQKNESTKY